jgi:hemolysin activation/secretion protein
VALHFDNHIRAFNARVTFHSYRCRPFQGAAVRITSILALAKSLFLLAAVAALSGAAQASGVDSPGATDKPAQENYFDVHEYRVLGNTTLSNRDIESVLYPLLGDHKTLADVENARAALEKTYHDHGFATVFIDIPEQDVTDQIVRLKVTEGRLRAVNISGARYYSERKILAAMPAAASGSVPKVPELQRQLATVNIQSADRTVVPVLKAGPVPGTVDLALKVDDHLPLHGSLELDNQNTPGTEPLRANASLSYSSLFGEFDTLAVQYQVSPQDVSQVSVLAANYAWAPLAVGLRPSIYFIDSNSDVPTVSALGVIGKGQIYGARFAFPVTDTLGMPQSITLGVDYKHFLESIGLPGTESGMDTGSSTLKTPISYTNLSVAYSGSWPAEVLSGSLSAAANFGPRGAPNNPDAFANKRFKAQANYFYLKLDGALVIRLPRGFQLSLRADGQFAVEPLISNEQFSITGADGVRGYFEAESLSDTGLKGGLQFQLPTISLHAFSLGDVFVFYDIGRADSIDSLPGEPASVTLRSWGAGLHLFPGRALNGLLTWADPLETGPNTRRGDARILFIVRASF